VTTRSDASQRKITDITGDQKIGTAHSKTSDAEFNKLMRGYKRKPTGSAYINMIFGEYQTNALLDTGAQVSAITREIYDSLMDAKYEMHVIPIQGVSIVGAFSSEGQTVLNRVQIKFEIYKTNFIYEFVVLESMDYNVVLGLDFMKQNYVSLDCEPEGVQIRFQNGIRFSAIYALKIDNESERVDIKPKRGIKNKTMDNGECSSTENKSVIINKNTVNPGIKLIDATVNKERRAIKEKISSREDLMIVKANGIIKNSKGENSAIKSPKITVSRAESKGQRTNNRIAKSETDDDKKYSSKECKTVKEVKHAIKEEANKFDAAAKVETNANRKKLSTRRSLAVGLGNKIVESEEESNDENNPELNRKLDMLEAHKTEAMRDECRSDAGLAEGKSTEGDKVSASQTVRAGENATLKAKLNPELSHRLDELEAQKTEAWRDECRSDAGLAEDKSTEGDNVSASHTVRAGENATLKDNLKANGLNASKYRRDKINAHQLVKVNKRKTEKEIKNISEDAKKLNETDKELSKKSVSKEKPGRVISIDIFGPLPQTPRGNKYILVTMDQFSKLTNLFVLRNQKLDAIMDALQIEYFPRNGVPTEILTDNGGQFVTNRWREFAASMGFSIRKTTPYNPQSNPVERVMRELGHIIRVYAHDRQTSWDLIIPRIEITINSTTHRSTECVPLDLHPDMEGFIYIDPRLKPIDEDDAEIQQQILEEKIQRTADYLRKRAAQRKRQTDKHGEAEAYQPGVKVWTKIHRRSDASRRLTRKIHLVYDGPYVIRNEIRPNAYTVEDENGDTIGVFNSRLLKPHREAKLKPAMEINMIRTDDDVVIIPEESVESFCHDLKNKIGLNDKRENALTT